MESARSDQNSGQNNDNIDNNVRLLTETEQSLTTTHGVADVLGSAHLSHQQDSSVTTAHGYAGGEGNSSIDFLASTTSGPQHHQPASSHHSIPSIPEDRTATVIAKHPSSDNQKEGCSPDPVSAATTGTTSTPTSVAGSSSPPPVDAVAKAAGPPPDFHGEGIRSGAGGNMLQGQPHWPPPIGDSMIGSRYGAGPANPVDDPDVGQYDLSPTEGGRYSSASFPCAIKLLVSNNVAGSIIGRAGQTISDLQAQSSTRIKLSQTGDYYPGSQDRVCLVQGQLDNVKGALSLLLERLYMLQEHQHTQHMAWQSNRSEGATPFDFVVRILVPTSSCGMIIGKSGSNIRQMEEASGVASVRLSPKDIVDPNYPSATITSATSERVVTLTGPTLDCCLNCLFIILDGMTSHPDICRYTNMTTSYSRIMPDQPFTGGSPSTLRGGPPPEAMHGPEWNPHYAQSQLSGLGKRVSSSPDLCGAFFNRAPMPLEPRPGPVGLHSGRDNVLYSPMFGGPAPPSSYSPIRPQPAPRMPPSSGQPQTPMYLNPPPMDSQGGPAPPPVSNSASAPDLLALQLESMHLPASPQQQQPPPQPGPPPTLGATHQDYPPFQSQSLGTGPVVTQQIMVPDNMIGSILGRGGRTLNELQVQSGTRIRISQRGEYMPGTRNRIVTIRGPNDHSVSLAQYLMSQRMILPRTATYQVPLGQSQSMPTARYSAESGHIPLSQSPASMPPLAYSDDGPPPEHLPFYHPPQHHHTDSTVQHQHPHHPQHHPHPHHHPPHAPTHHHQQQHHHHHSPAQSSTSPHHGPSTDTTVQDHTAGTS